jgi:hypothetical protein
MNMVSERVIFFSASRKLPESMYILPTQRYVSAKWEAVVSPPSTQISVALSK